MTPIAGCERCCSISVAVWSNTCQHHHIVSVVSVVCLWPRCDDEGMSSDVQVLIVDDQLPFREASRMVVEMTDGFDVSGEAENGQRAIELVAELQPDLVLMDVQMPGIDGIETTRQIAALPDPPAIIVMSTHESGDYEQMAVAAGAVAFVPKSQFGMDRLEDLWAAANPS